MVKTPMRKMVIAIERKTVIGSWRKKVIAERKRIGSRSRLERGARRSPSALRRKIPVIRQRET
jgi:hypothetical protein